MTLIELLITITLIGIVAVTAIPNLTEWVPKGRLESDLNQLYSRLTFLRHRAIVEGRSYRLDLDPTGSPPCNDTADPDKACFNTLANSAEMGCSIAGADNINEVDDGALPSPDMGTAIFAPSPVLTPNFTPLPSCIGGTGICEFPTDGIRFDAAGNVIDGAGVINLILGGVERYRIQVFSTGYLTKSRRRTVDDPWLEF